MVSVIWARDAPRGGNQGAELQPVAPPSSFVKPSGKSILLQWFGLPVEPLAL